MSEQFSLEDHAFMVRALALTERGRDTATPNPSVGCVIVKDGRVIAEGWHERAGEPHAEVRALAAAKEPVEGATVYLSLEPCSHHGRTPPCADALIAAKVGRVVAALEDPNPKVKGRGAARLREAGIRVDIGLLVAEALEAHRGFVWRMTRARPWMRIKAAASLDGRIALANGESQWLTGEAARRDVHALRARSCAMLTGIGTVLADDPELTVRHVPCTEVVVVPREGEKTDLAAIARLLAERGFNEVTVETGGKLMGSLLQARIVDELVIYYAPLILGDKARALFVLPEWTSLGEALRPTITEVRTIGDDIRVSARFEGA